MSSEGRCPTHLIVDEPADRDAFGSHDHVADSIVEIVRTEPGGGAIGLEGGQGTGKSTIVKLVSNKLPDDGDLNKTVAVFDIWAHQGDPLRRTFLENIR